MSTYVASTGTLIVRHDDAINGTFGGDPTLEPRVAALEVDPTTQAAVDAVQADVDANETASDAADTALSGRLDVLEVDPTTQAAVDAVQADVDANETASDAADTALSGRLDTVETNAARYNALELLSRTSLWTAQDASGSTLPSRTAALPATLTGLTRVDGPCVVSAFGSNGLRIPTLAPAMATSFEIVADINVASQATYSVLLGAVVSSVGLRADLNSSGQLGVFFNGTGIATSVAPSSWTPGNRVWLKIGGTVGGTLTVESQTWASPVEPTSGWQSFTTPATVIPATTQSTEPIGILCRNQAGTAAVNGAQASLSYARMVVDGATVVELTPADIAAVSGDATTITATSGQTVTVNRATSGRQTQIVPRGSVLVNSDPTNSSNQALTTLTQSIATGDDAMILWAGQPGNPIASLFMTVAGSDRLTDPRFLILRNQAATEMTGLVDDGPTAVFPGYQAMATAGRQVFATWWDKSAGLLWHALIAEGGTVTKASADASAVTAQIVLGSVFRFARGVELTYAAAIGTGIGLADLIDDDTLVALHDLLALQKWDEVEALSAVVGGMTPTERDKLTGLGERVWIEAADMVTGTGSPALASVAGIPGWLMDPTSNEDIAAQVIIPDHWNTCTAYAWFRTADATTGTVVFRGYYRQLGDGIDPTGSTSIDAAANAPGATTLKRQAFASAFAVTGGAPIKFAVQRRATTDTYAADVALCYVELVRTS